MLTCSMKWNYSSNYATVFLYKRSSRAKYNYYFINRFLINAALLNVYLLFFRKEINFFKCLYFTKYDIRMSLYVFFGWARDRQVSTYVIGEGMGSCQMLTATYMGRGCHASLVRTHLHRFSCFWQNVCLIVSCFIYRNLTLPLFKKDVFIRNGFYFSKKRNFCHHKKIFCLKLFLQAKIS